MADLNGWIDRDVASVWHGFTQMEAYAGNSPVIVERGEGRELIDIEGNRYLDAISSLWVTTLGHGVPELDQAVRDQLGRVAHTTMLGHGNRIVIELAEALAPRVPVDRPRFLFASDGAAAVEQAIKIAFQYWTNQGVTGRTKYLAFTGAYHGDTIGSLAIGDGGFGTDVFDPLRFPVLRTPCLGEPGAVDEAIRMIAEHAHELAAVVLEPLVQGAAGMALVPADAVAAVARAAADHDVLVIHDEVATGFGRTGTLFATEQCGVQPDLMVIGKGITGGYLPLAATVASQRVWEAFLGPDLSEMTFYHGHSYSGNALGCAVALRHLELLDEWDVLQNVNDRAAQLGRLLAAQIEPLAGVAAVRRCGLMTGIELAPPADGLRWGRKVSAACVERGVLIRPLGDVIVIMPPLTTTAEEIVRIVDALEAAIRLVAAG
ncbi:adenosylmethionine--8-amino-7-oxononanoate transaminase [Aquihabitans sp. McL0605]|uniref:adenosylmethionine--8-amino-7-oxononanoate transaminase n=1 Tax=Aquihabitans sp. McL0605 TaxID=3415671 RepID=UPI003CEF00D5